MFDRNRYKAMVGEIKASDELRRKVMSIPAREPAGRPLAMRCAACVCTALLAAFLASNGVCYAATGETWVEVVVLWMNGREVAVDVEVREAGDAAQGWSAFEATGDEGRPPSDIAPAEGSDGEGDGPEGPSIVRELDAGAAIVESPEGDVLLCPSDSSPIDITSQMESEGRASGEYESNGKSYRYRVVKGPDGYSLEIREKQTAAGA